MTPAAAAAASAALSTFFSTATNATPVGPIVGMVEMGPDTCLIQWVEDEGDNTVLEDVLPCAHITIHER